MKNITLFILLISFLGFSQRKREVIDSIHLKRLCVEYPGIVDISTVSHEFDKSEYVFIGKVIEIIRIETLKSSDLDENGPTDFRPIQNYWYVFEVSEQFKGKNKKQIKVFARIYSSISPLLILDKEYLIYAKKVTEREKRFLGHSDPYIYCGDRSSHLKYAKKDIIELKKLLN
ncbi:hypothetical protein QSV08_07735 [Maribacter sp. BPC-D8]|uniref:hypothetical protein n=1 Tax=Maribacter sp. BPC-D8 TaxID=3053613 RepID=UPI002B477A31|nr:hypothetical protein [Maribacter sp. BPC-D8]WRI31135.1 hypothetical protein QSV08_07735 [Maribacter sp. BPC-D8]